MVWWMIGIVVVGYAICDLLDEHDDGSHIVAFLKRLQIRR